MPLPELIEIVPLDKPICAEITVPGSKSITNRALILAALTNGSTILKGALWSEDTQIMVDCLKQLGFEIKVQPDPEEFCNRTITVHGLGGQIPRGGTADEPLELFVGNAGTAARFLSAFVCLGDGVYRIHGVPRMHERPQAALFSSLRQLGYRVDSANDRLPAIVYGTEGHSHRVVKPLSAKFAADLTLPGAKRTCTVSIEQSSQFASALLLCAKTGDWLVNVVGENAEESPYVAMTSKMIESFPQKGGEFQVEPDASSGSYFIAAQKIAEPPTQMEYSEQWKTEVPTQYLNSITVISWPDSGCQIDERFQFFPTTGALLHHFLELGENPFSVDLKAWDKFVWDTPDNLKEAVISRNADLGDSIMTAIVISPFMDDPIRFTDLGRLRLQETERVVALRTELTKCGARVEEQGDTLTVYPSKLHGAEIETYNDHRMAMCFAVLGLKVPGIKIRNPSCVKKTFPNFFQKLATAQPKGLGVTILDATTRRPLGFDELFAD